MKPDVSLKSERFFSSKSMQKIKGHVWNCLTKIVSSNIHLGFRLPGHPNGSVVGGSHYPKNSSLLHVEKILGRAKKTRS